MHTKGLYPNHILQHYNLFSCTSISAFYPVGCGLAYGLAAVLAVGPARFLLLLYRMAMAGIYDTLRCTKSII